MAEATDRPQVPPGAVMPQEQLGARTPAPTETYQPLSLLAMAGFGLSIVYALVVLIGGAVALLSHIPWLMPYWNFLLPIAIVVVCWVARTRILTSEGTLSGLAFTTWGSRFAILFGVTYAAYYFATFLAVRGPAIDCANDFFQKIKEGHLDQAFAQSQDISIKNRDKDALRDEIETRFNQPSATGGIAQPGPFSNFCQQHFVRYIEMDGDKAQTTPTGVDAWEFSKDRYRVLLTYHIATSLVEFDLKVDTVGRDPKPGEPKGRQWQTMLMRSETSVVPASMKYTEKGRDFAKKMANAMKFAAEWASKVTDVDALKPEERDRYSKLIRGYDTFWSSKALRDEITQYIHKTFQPSTGGRRFSMNFQPNGLPFMRESDDRTTAWVDMMMRYTEEGGVIPAYVVEGRLVVSADTSAARDSSEVWRVDALEISSARTAPERRRFQKRLEVPPPEEAGLGNGLNPANRPAGLPPIRPQQP